MESVPGSRASRNSLSPGIAGTSFTVLLDHALTPLFVQGLKIS